MERLTRLSYQQGLDWLSRSERRLGAIRERFGDPPFWSRDPGFPTLVHIVLEQQVSLASARAAFNRLLDAVDPLTPQAFLEFEAHELKSIGFSRQKTAACRRIASAIVAGELDLAGLEAREDEEVKRELVRIRGIGPWTANIYLLMALGRPDIFPTGDLALASAVQEVFGHSERPGAAELEELTVLWRPWRSVAARLLWHYYLSTDRSNRARPGIAEG